MTQLCLSNNIKLPKDPSTYRLREQRLREQRLKDSVACSTERTFSVLSI